jgi:4-amino-4-deoxy-L-arabinose transferase-like glycosyltransferase
MGRGAAVGLLCTLFVALAVLVNQSAVHWRENVVDSHLFAYFGWCVGQGARPYLDVWDNKPPAIWWLNAAGFRLCGEGIGGELLISGAALAASLAAFIGIARRAYDPSVTVPAAILGAALLTHLRYECGANRTETFVVTCETLAIFAYVRWWRGGRTGWLVAAGLAAGLAPLFKQSGLAVAAAGALHLAWMQIRWTRRSSATGRSSATAGATSAAVAEPRHHRPDWRPWVAAGAGLAVFPLAVALALFRTGALGAAWHAVSTFNRAYFDIGDASWLRVDRALGTYWEVLPPLAGLFALAAAGAAWSAWACSRAGVSSRRRFRAEDSPALSAGVSSPVGLFWAWFLLAAYLACVGPGRRGHHFMPVLPALGLLALDPLHRLAVPAGLVAKLTARPTGALVLVLYAYVAAALVQGSLAEATACWRAKPHWYSLDYARPPPYQLQAAQVRRLAGPADTIYVWGWSPGTYRYAYRRPASRYATLEKLGQVGARAAFILDAARADLQAAPPRVLVISVKDLAGLRAEPLGRWIDDTYADQGVVAGMHVLLRR